MDRPIEVSARSQLQIVARLDRLNVWSLSYLFIGIIGTGWLFTFYDIFDINVSFIQTCVQIKPGCTPRNAVESLTLPVMLNLVGYVIGALVLSPVCDRVGRRNMLLVTMLITGLGSLYNALVLDYPNFVAARFVTAVGIGADLTIVNVYINEVAPRRGRAKFTALIFIMSALGALLGIWLGLLLATEPGEWPAAIPFALATENFTSGWRWMYGIGAALALVAVLVRVKLPESPRWLLARARVEEAELVVAEMEKRAMRRGPLADPVVGPEHAGSRPVRTPYREILGSRLYRRRAAILMLVWFAGYMTVYAYAAGFTGVLTALAYTPATAGVIVAVGALGFVASSILMSVFAERLERRYWLPIYALVTMVGAVLTAMAGDNLTVAFIGSAIIFFGFNGWVSPTYALSAECFPTRARSTGVALVDGVGHIGGGIGILAIAPYLPELSAMGALLPISAGLVVAAAFVQFMPHTRNRNLDSISP